MHRRNVAFAAFHRRDAAHAADRDDAGRKAPVRRAASIMASSATHGNCHMMTMSGRPGVAVPISVTFLGGAGIEAGAERIDRHEAIGLGERRHGAGTLADRELLTGPCSPGTNAPPARTPAGPSLEAMRTGTVASIACVVSAGSPARARTTGATKAWKVEDRRGRKARQHRNRLAVAHHHREAGKRSPGFSATPCTRTPGGRAASESDRRGRPRPSRCRRKAAPCRIRRARGAPLFRAWPPRSRKCAVTDGFSAGFLALAATMAPLLS